MPDSLPPVFPRQAISLASILLVVLLLSFPSYAKVISAIITSGGAVYFILSKMTAAEPAVRQMPLRDQVSQAAPLKQPAQEPKAAAQPPRAGTQSSPVSQTAAKHASPQAAEKSPAVSAATADQGNVNAATPAVASSASAGVGNGVAQVENAPAVREAVEPVRAAPAAAAPKPLPNGAGASAVPQTGGAAVLARLRQQRAKNKAAQKEVREVVVAYASQTGTAQEIAKGIQAESASHGVKSKVMSLNELSFEALAAGKAPVLVVIASSTGEGESPDNAAKFYATMRRRTQEADALKGVKFTCLGLGDSNYTRFMGVSRAIRMRLQELGAEVFYKMAEADEVDGIESIVDSWIDSLWPALKAAASATQEPVAAVREAPAVAAAAPKEDGLVGVPALAACRIALRWVGDAKETSGQGNGDAKEASHGETTVRDPEGMYSPEQPYWAPVTAARYLTAPTSDRKVLHLEVDLGGSSMEYQPGDSLGVTPLNPDAMVDALLARLGASGGRRFEAVAAEEGGPSGLLPHLGCPCSLRSALQRGCDLTSVPRKSLLRLLAEHCKDPKEKHQLLHLSSKGGREDYAALVSPVNPSLLDLLRRYPSCQPPLAHLLDALPPLAPRLYSISSSPLEHGTKAQVAFSVVRIGQPPANVSVPSREESTASPAEGGRHVEGRWGIATGWLERQVEPLLQGSTTASVVKLPLHLRKGGSFRHPDNLAAPMVMVGPGTGVAPFRGFLEHRRRLVQESGSKGVGEAVLYFGCRRAEEDFLYREDLEAAQRDGTLSRLEVAFSRAGPEKVYVQHLMRKQGEQLCPLLLDVQAHIFVCGDGANMAKDVHSTLLDVLEAHGGLSATEAAAHLAAMTKDGRYIRDIWS